MYELILETWITKIGNKVTAVTTELNGKRIVLTFDYNVIAKLAHFDFEEIKALDVGVIKLCKPV